MQFKPELSSAGWCTCADDATINAMQEDRNCGLRSYPRTVLISVLVASALGCDARLKWIALLYIIVEAGVVGKSRG